MSEPFSAMELLLQAAQATGFAHGRCRACAHAFYPPQGFCPHCLSPDVEAAAADPHATVLSTTRLHRTLDPAQAAALPMHVACVQTAGGLSLFAMADALLPPGTPVRLQVRDGKFHVDLEG